MSYSIIRGSTTLGCPKPSAVLWHEVVGTEHYQVDNGIIHRKAMNIASQWIVVTTKHGVQCMSRTLEEGGRDRVGTRYSLRSQSWVGRERGFQ